MFELFSLDKCGNTRPLHRGTTILKPCHYINGVYIDIFTLKYDEYLFAYL